MLTYYVKLDFLIDISSNKKFSLKWKHFYTFLLYTIISKSQLLFQRIYFISQCKNICTRLLKKNINFIKKAKYVAIYASLTIHSSVNKGFTWSDFRSRRNCFNSSFSSKRRVRILVVCVYTLTQCRE